MLKEDDLLLFDPNTYSIDVLGVVPSQLITLNSRKESAVLHHVRHLILWGDSVSKYNNIADVLHDVQMMNKENVTIYDMLIATEYWFPCPYRILNQGSNEYICSRRGSLNKGYTTLDDSQYKVFLLQMISETENNE